MLNYGIPRAASNTHHMSIVTHVKRRPVKIRSSSYVFTANIVDTVTHQASWATPNLGKNVVKPDQPERFTVVDSKGRVRSA